MAARRSGENEVEGDIILQLTNDREITISLEPWAGRQRLELVYTPLVGNQKVSTPPPETFREGETQLGLLPSFSDGPDVFRQVGMSCVVNREIVLER